MNLSISIEQPGDGMAESYATQIKAQHELQAFSDAYALSTWMHQRFANPRVVIETSEHEDQITVRSRTVPPGAKRHTVHLTINLY